MVFGGLSYEGMGVFAISAFAVLTHRNLFPLFPLARLLLYLISTYIFL